IGEVIVGEDGRWEFTPDPELIEGPHPITVIVTDPAGNASEPSDPYIVIVDTTAPVAPTIDSVFDDQGTSTGNIMPGDITDDSQPEIRGQAEPGTTVIIYDNGREIGRVPVAADGSWTHTPVPPLLNGPHDLTAEAVDADGNTSAPSNSVDFELVAGGLPPAPSITGVFDDIADNVGNIMPGESTNDTEPQVSGTAEAFSTVTLFANGVPVGSVVADALGNWTITPSPALAPGLNNLTATATNSAGNVSPATGDYPITVDITPPAAADASQLEDNVGAITGPINSGDITDDNTPTFSGTAEPNTTLIIYDGGVEIDRVPVDGAGNWSYTPARPLADGPHSFSTEVVDAAGNRSPESTPIDFTVDTSAVAISIEQALDNVGPNQDPLASGSVTDDTTPTLRGQATPGSTVNIYLDGVLLQEGVAVNNAGRWEYEVNPPLPEGSYAFTATVVTAAGGESAPTADFNLEIDLTPPAAPTIDEIRDDVGDIQDPLVDGSTTDDTTPTLVGSGVAGDTIIIRNNGNELDRVTVQPDGSWTYTPNPALNNGSTNVFDVIAQDPAGNQSAPSAPWTVIIDTTAPITQITSVINDDGTPTPINPGDETTDRTPLISGTSEPGSTVTIFDSGVPIDTVQVDEFGNWSYSVVTPLSSGSHGLTASSVDLAGNQGPVSDQFDLRITSVFGTYSNIESFDGAPLGGIAVGSVLDLKAMAITNISGSSDVVPVNPNTISDPMLRIYGKLDFDLKGDSSSVLVMEASGLGAQHINEIRFYDANGVLIHTDTVSKEPGSQQFIMPGGMEFSRFEIETDVNAGSGLFVDNLILANGPIKTEGFEGLPLNHKFDLGVPFELDLFTLIRIENNVPRGAGVGLINQGHAAGQQLAILGAKVEFDLKGETASTLNFKLTLQAGRVLDTIITFYNADGELIHTEIMLGGSDGLRHISMPDGLEFSSFVIDNPDSRHLYINEISFADLALPNLPLADESNTTSDHVIYVTEGDEAALVAEGSDAIDTLVLTGANQLLDLSALGNQVSSI
ncbi:Ig-like domain-containing protein, partial [Pseudomonas shahriarae]|uniref:Ig-like domain-containing protein n=1 Tax=Pseudomonas shahriarae TaxID=2745512 RepID=UPI00249C06B4